MPGFDRIANFYDRLARLVYGQAIVKAQCHFLSQIPPGSSVLIIGGGTGWILEKIIQTASPGYICYLEASEEMIALAKAFALENLPHDLTRIDFKLGTQEKLKELGAFDAVITFFFLDMFQGKRLGQVMKRLREKMNPGAIWLFADFHHPTNKFRPIANLLIWTMYRFFRIVAGIEAEALPDFETHFGQLSLEKMGEAAFYHGMIVTRRYKVISMKSSQPK